MKHTLVAALDVPTRRPGAETGPGSGPRWRGGAADHRDRAVHSADLQYLAHRLARRTQHQPAARCGGLPVQPDEGTHTRRVAEVHRGQVEAHLDAGAAGRPDRRPEPVDRGQVEVAGPAEDQWLPWYPLDLELRLSRCHAVSLPPPTRHTLRIIVAHRENGRRGAGYLRGGRSGDPAGTLVVHERRNNESAAFRDRLVRPGGRRAARRAVR